MDLFGRVWRKGGEVEDTRPDRSLMSIADLTFYLLAKPQWMAAKFHGA